MAPPRTPRAELIADTALALLTERGMRGLTHRAVDEAAGLPQGSTSNHARTRAALLQAAVARLAEREERTLAPQEAQRMAAGADGLADALALALHRAITDGRQLTLARFELALEATRRPELRAVYDAAGQRFREPLARLLAAAGSTAPQRHAHSLVSWCEGAMFYATAGAGVAAPPTRTQLREDIRELLHGMLE
jgi:DNA-binding transcriptional regulator YbjK